MIVQVKKISDPWPKPDSGLNALSVDGSFDDEGTRGSRMVLREPDVSVIFSAYRNLANCFGVRDLCSHGGIAFGSLVV